MQMSASTVISVSSQAVDNMVRSCATDTSTAALQQFLQSNGGNAFYYNRDFACTGADVVWQPSAAAINRALYCGYRQACTAALCPCVAPSMVPPQ